MLVAILTTLLRAHRVWAWVVIIGNGLVGLWGVVAHAVPRLRGRPFWAAVVVGHALIAVQVALGAYLYARGLRPGNFHIFYGALLVVAPTLAWTYRTEPAVRRRIYLFYGGASLFFMGLAVRAFTQVQ